MSRLNIATRSQTLLLRHLQVFFYSLGQLSRHPLSLFMTAAVIGIALALPTGLHVLLQNAQQLSGRWDGRAQISLFLKKSVSDQQARSLARQLRRRDDIAKVSYISREQALKEFQQQSGFGDALKALEKNPLPSVLIVQPTSASSQPEQTARLLDQLRHNIRVDVAQLDMQWLKRLYAIMDIVRRGVLVLAGLLALAVLLVVGNTIRLAIQNRRNEIVVMKLIGGTDAFIRRPFLYTGFWYGFFGALLAFIMVYTALLLLSGPVEKLTRLYHNSFELSRLDLGTALVLLASGVMLGLVGSWLAVGRHLREIEPG
ncbi:MAG TPA: cell division protein FtsX [Gammaproteobacteria bacterium]|nr:cell division protein FtsX [Gammaproteobacteria bacterium]